RERSQLLGLGRPPQLVDRRDAELVPDPSRRLRAETRQAHEEHDLRRDDVLPLRERVHFAVLDDLDDLLLDRLADPVQLLRAPGQRELGDGARKTIEEKIVQVVDRKSTRLNSSHGSNSYAVFCLKK